LSKQICIQSILLYVFHEFDLFVDEWEMTSKWLLLLLYLFNIFNQIKSRESLLQCWKCEITKESTEEAGVFLDGM